MITRKETRWDSIKNLPTGLTMKTNSLPAFAASLVVLLVATSSSGIAFGQRLAIPDAATAATQEQAWWLDESTAALVPFPSRLPGVQR